MTKAQKVEKTKMWNKETEAENLTEVTYLYSQLV